MLRFYILSCFVLLSNHSLISQSAVLQKNWWFPNGSVNRTVVDTAEDRVYIGGNFDMVGPYQSYGAVLGLNSMSVRENTPMPDSTVTASISDGHNGWFIGGKFQMIGDSLRKKIAHLDSNGNVTALLHDAQGIAGYINRMIMDDSILYLGGNFNSVFGSSRKNLAAINVKTGKITPWNADTDGEVLCMILVNGKLYVGGDFTSVSGSTRFRLACMDLKTGALTPWNPAANSAIEHVAVYQNSVYVAGATQINGNGAHPICVIDSTGKNTSTLNIASTSNIGLLKIHNNTLFVSGDFTAYANSTDYTNAVAYDLNSKKILAWNPSPNGFINEIIFLNKKMILAGDFSMLKNGKFEARRFAIVDDSTGNLDTLFCHTGRAIKTASISGNSVYLGGEFISTGGVVRNNLARYSLSTGKPDFWNPSPNNVINSILVINDRVIISGYFSRVGKRTVYGLAAIGKNSDTALNWNTSTSGVSTMAFENSRLYVGGSFSSLNGQSRNNIGCIDTTYGYAYNWNPGASGSVSTMHVFNGRLFVGGNFAVIGGKNYRAIAILSPDSNIAETTKFGNTISSVYCIYNYANRIFIGGSLGSLFSGSSVSAAEVSPVDGATVGTWRPASNGLVYAITSFRNSIVLGGYFNKTGSANRLNMAIVNTTNGAPMSANNPINGIVSSLSSKDDLLFCAGNFTAVSQNKRQGFAVFKDTCNGFLFDTLRITSCGTYFRDNKAYAVSTTIDETDYNTEGCPLKRHIIVTINPEYNITIVKSACHTFTFGGKTFTQSAQHTFLYKTTLGCDSTITLDITIDERDSKIYIPSPGVLATYAIPASYKWFRCDSNYKLIPGADSQFYKPTASGLYGVIVKYGDCTDTSNCLNIWVTGLNKVTADGVSLPYPNPGGSIVYLDVNGNAGIQNIDLINAVGQRTPIPYHFIDGRAELDVHNVSPGTYYLLVRQERGSTRHVLLIE